MAFSTESLQNEIPNVQNTSLKDLPTREFVSYDTSTAPSKKENSEDVKQPSVSEGSETPPPEESVTLSPKVSAIARREQAQRQREQALKQREKDLEARFAKAERLEKLGERIANKDYSAAEELGLKYDEYTEHLVSGQQKKNPEAERIAKLESALEQFKKSQEERVVEEYEANQGLWKQEISRVVSDNDEFSTIKELSAEDMVLAHINDSFDEDGVRLTTEQAAREIESALIERAEKFASLSKIQKKIVAPKETLGAPPVPKNISQNLTVSSQKPVKKPFHLMSESEQIAEAFRRVQEAKMQR